MRPSASATRLGTTALATAVLATTSLAASAGSYGGASAAYGAPSHTGAWVARLVAPTPVAATPEGPLLERLQPSTPATGSSTTLLVLGSAAPSGELWLKVRLPNRPNDGSGWIGRDAAVVERTEYRVEISTQQRLLTLRRAGHVVMRTRVVVGTSATPTPHGLFALYDTVPLAGSVYAPYELQLTAHSEVLQRFDGGEGRVALHGMNGALRSSARHIALARLCAPAASSGAPSRANSATRLARRDLRLKTDAPSRSTCSLPRT